MANGIVGKTVIAEDVEITGSIKCESDVQLSGKLNGDLTCTGSAVITETAVVKGNITAGATSIQGQIVGNITVRDRIEMKSTARVTGDIKARRLTVEDGVTFIGKSEVNPAAAPATPGLPEPSRAAEPPRDNADAGGDRADDSRRGGLFGRR